MADYDCGFCRYESECPWSYDDTICRVKQIQAAKSLVDDDYISLFASLLKKNSEICDERIESFLYSMRDIMRDSWIELPSWANNS